MKLSIVIVNYNVRHFLEQCLQSTFKAIAHVEAEVFVVDNNSVDGSMAMVKEKFPEAICIENKENVGFAKANNQAMRLAKGDYILLLNPDTVVQEDTFSKVINYMDANVEVGGLGVKMIDGKANFLPESKRGLPTPMVALYKLSGLIRLFPKNKRFAKYYMGHLPENETNEVEVLAGAFMLMRKNTLDKVGLLDEDYFMYGEDIDLSYRILKGGYKNVYFADTQIIHYKGESTKKGSMNYVFIFYQAMQIFAKKHFSSGQAKLYNLVIKLAIWLRAAVSVFNRLLTSIATPLTDAAVIYGGMYYIKLYWEHNHRFIQGGHYPSEFMQIAVPAYIAVWLLGVFFSGGYDKPTRSWNLWRGLASATLITLALYGLLSEDYRFSRALILLGAVWAAIALPLWRTIYQLLTKRSLLLDVSSGKRRIIIGSWDEYKRIESLLSQTGAERGFTGWIDSSKTNDSESLGTISQMDEIIKIYRIDEVIFCAKDLSSQAIIEQMSVLQPHKLEIKIAPPESMFVIGSNSINAQGEWYTIQVNTITKAGNKRLKRLVDVTASVCFIALLPIMFIVQKRPLMFLKNTFSVLFGLKSWVGYHPKGSPENLPKIKRGVLFPTAQTGTITDDEQTLSRVNFLYAKEYSAQTDIEIIVKSLRELGN